MSEITNQTYKDQRWNYLHKVDNFVSGFYVDKKGNLTVGVGRQVVGKTGKSVNRSIYEAANPSDAIASAIMNSYANAVRDYGGETYFQTKAEYNKSSFKAALENEGLLTSFELVGDKGSAWAINIVGYKTVSVDGSVTVATTRNIVDINIGRAMTGDYIDKNKLEQKIDTYFGEKAQSLSDGQRNALVSELYHFGSGQPEKVLKPLEEAFYQMDQAGLFLAFSRNREGEPARAMSDFLEFTHAATVPVTFTPRNIRSGTYFEDSAGRDVVIVSVSTGQQIITVDRPTDFGDTASTPDIPE